jgi:hypothetical protein
MAALHRRSNAAAGETQCGSLVEVGAALAAGKAHVYIVSDYWFSVGHHSRCRIFKTLEAAIAAIKRHRGAKAASNAMLRARRERPRGCRTAEQGDEIAASHVLPSVRGITCYHIAMENAALCITAKVGRRWQRWVIFVRSIRLPAWRHVRFTTNSVRTFARQRNDARCQEATYAVQQIAAYSTPRRRGRAAYQVLSGRATWQS